MKRIPRARRPEDGEGTARRPETVLRPQAAGGEFLLRHVVRSTATSPFDTFRKRTAEERRCALRAAVRPGWAPSLPAPEKGEARPGEARSGHLRHQTISEDI